MYLNDILDDVFGKWHSVSTIYPDFLLEDRVGTLPGIYEYDVPGIKKEDIKISVKAHCLHITATTGKRSFSNVVSLNKSVNEDTIKAECADGVLTLILEAKEETTKQLDEKVVVVK